MGIGTRLVMGLGWLALSYVAFDKPAGRRVISFVSGILVMLMLCIMFMNQLNPWLEETRRISRDSLKGLFIGMGAGLILGLAVSPFLARISWLFWIAQVVLFLGWVIVPSLRL